MSEPKKINRKGYIPRFAPTAFAQAPKSPRRFSRAAYLDGTFTTYYGPGQPPDAGEPQKYRPPTDWARAGQLLRVPQVVWLSAWMQDLTFKEPDLAHGGPGGVVSYVGPYRSYWPDPNPPGREDWVADANYLVANGDFGVVSGFGTEDGHIDVTYTDDTGQPVLIDDLTSETDVGAGTDQPVQNPYPAEYSRLLEAFRAAKLHIETIRAGKTFVQVNEFFLNDGAGHALPNFFAGVSRQYYLHMIAPKPSLFLPYLGTDFLHVYAGDPTTTAGVTPSQVEVTPEDVEADSTFENGWSNVKFAHDSGQLLSNRFAGYSLRLFALPAFDGDDGPEGGGGGGGPRHPRTPKLPPQVFARGPKPTFKVPATYFTGPVGAGTPHSYDLDPWFPNPRSASEDPAPPQAPGDPPYDHQFYDQSRADALAQAGLDTEVANANATVDSVNAQVEDAIQQRRDLLKAQAEFMEAGGVDASYVGTTGAITAESLIAMIAEHYGFDAQTGQDIAREGP